MIVNQWKRLIEDGMVYRLAKVSKPDVVPWRFSLEWSADYIPASKATRNVHPLDRIYVAEDNIGEVEDSAFNDFDHLCSFAKEVAALLECEPTTIIRAI